MFILLPEYWGLTLCFAVFHGLDELQYMDHNKRKSEGMSNIILHFYA